MRQNSFYPLCNIGLTFFQWMLTLTVILNLSMKTVKRKSYFQKDNGMLQFKLEKMCISKFIRKLEQINMILKTPSLIF